MYTRVKTARTRNFTHSMSLSPSQYKASAANQKDVIVLYLGAWRERGGEREATYARTRMFGDVWC